MAEQPYPGLNTPNQLVYAGHPNELAYNFSGLKEHYGTLFGFVAVPATLLHTLLRTGISMYQCLVFFF